MEEIQRQKFYTSKYASVKLPIKLTFSFILLTIKHDRPPLRYHTIEKKDVLTAEYLIPG